jgi:hypothetical protein
MKEHHVQEFRDDVVKVARMRQTSIRQVARNFVHLCCNALPVAGAAVDLVDFYNLDRVSREGSTYDKALPSGVSR